jgi:hypothetical protein
MYLDASNTKSLADVPSRNLITWSEDFTNGTWKTSNISVTANQSVSPSGLQDADLVDDGVVTNTQHWLYQNPTFLYNTTYTLSVFTKYISRKYMTINIYNGVTSQYVDYDILNGVVYGTTGDVTATIQSYGNSWYRLSYTRTIAATGTPNFRIAMADDFGSETYTGSNKQVYLYGAQLELGSVATTYIPTTTVAVSRTPTWTDLSRGGNNGTLTNNPTYDYSNGGGIVLTNTFNTTGSSVTQRVVVPNSPSIRFTTGMSADIWFYPNGSTQPSTLPRLLEKGDFYLLIFQTLPSNLSFNVSSIAGGRSITSINSPITNTTRINVTTTYDGQISKIYINGVLNNTTDWGSVSLISPTSTDLSIGDNFGWVRTFNGTIYSTKLYNRALSASEVLQNYNTTKSRFGL